MKFEVVLTERAKSQLDAACVWHVEHAPSIADDWYNGLIDTLLSLEENPERFSLARETQHFAVELRQLLFGVGRRKTHRAIFSIHTDRVVVRSIRHLSQRDLRSGDI